MRLIQFLSVFILLNALCIPPNVVAFMTSNQQQLPQHHDKIRHTITTTELCMARNGKPAKSHEEDLELTVKVVLGGMSGEKEVNGSNHPKVENTPNKEGRSFRRFVRRIFKKILGDKKQ